MASRDLSAFGSFLEYFKGIEYDDFVTLQPEHIKEAIPELVPRIKFQNMLKKFIEDKSKTDVANHSSNVEENCFSESFNDPKLADFAKVPAPSFDEESFTAVTAPVDGFEFFSSADALFPASAEIQTKIRTVQDIIDIPSISLKVVITKHVNSDAILSDHERVTVAKTIIHHLLVKEFCRVITREEFIELAKLIVQLLPRELLGTYYIPAVKSQPADGKLFHAYQNYKAALRDSGLISKRTKVLISRDGKPKLAEKSEAFKIILEEIDNFDTIVESWNFCYQERINLLTELSTFEYVRKFPAFNLANGYELLLLDANKLLGEKTSRLAALAPKILLKASQKKRSCPEIKSILAAYRESTLNLDYPSELRQLYAIKLLPFVMPLGKKKLNRSTVAQLFCPFFKTEREAEEHNVLFKEEYKESSVILKPRFYFVGDSSSPNVHIHITDKKFIINNFLIGFDAVFKCFLGLNCSFPDETQHVWQFVQSEVYGIESGNERLSSTVQTFFQDIRNIDFHE